MKAIILHRTATDDLGSALVSFRNSGIGTHFIIDRMGRIDQTASLEKLTYHVGKIRARCGEEGTCDAAELQAINRLGWAPTAIFRREVRIKSYPDRYPTNPESIRTEIVGQYDAIRRQWQKVTAEQLRSLKSLFQILQDLYGFTNAEIYQHDVISYKTPGEGDGLGY